MNIERSSTRLHAPPGGKSSFSIGMGYDEQQAAPVKRQPAPVQQAPTPERVVRATAPVSTNNIFGAENVPSRAPPAREQNNILADDASKPAAGVRPAVASMDNIGTESGRPSVRVRQVPGGTSSIVIG